MGHMYGNRNELVCLKDARKITWIFHAFLKKTKSRIECSIRYFQPSSCGTPELLKMRFFIF